MAEMKSGPAGNRANGGSNTQSNSQNKRSFSNSLFDSPNLKAADRTIYDKVKAMLQMPELTDREALAHCKTVLDGSQEKSELAGILSEILGDTRQPETDRLALLVSAMHDYVIEHDTGASMVQNSLAEIVDQGVFSPLRQEEGGAGEQARKTRELLEEIYRNPSLSPNEKLQLIRNLRENSTVSPLIPDTILPTNAAPLASPLPTIVPIRKPNFLSDLLGNKSVGFGEVALPIWRGQPYDVMLGPGGHFLMFGAKLIKIDVRPFLYKPTPLHLRTREGTRAEITLMAHCIPNPDLAVPLVTWSVSEAGKRTDPTHNPGIEPIIIDPILLPAARDVLSNTPVYDLVRYPRAIENEIHTLARAALARSGVYMHTCFLSNVELPASVEQMLEERMAIEAQIPIVGAMFLLRMKESRLELFDAEVKQKLRMINVDADAYAARVMGLVEAEIIKAKNDAITEDYLRQISIWAAAEAAKGMHLNLYSLEGSELLNGVLQFVYSVFGSAKGGSNG
ncbi:MAG: SPFH domain-containing protein [Candidatus Micrarchaeia archaeon]|jgi:hypothetical protein